MITASDMKELKRMTSQDARHLLNVYKPFSRCPGGFLVILCTFNLCPMVRGKGINVQPSPFQVGLIDILKQ